MVLPPKMFANFLNEKGIVADRQLLNSHRYKKSRPAFSICIHPLLSGGLQEAVAQLPDQHIDEMTILKSTVSIRPLDWSILWCDLLLSMLILRQLWLCITYHLMNPVFSVNIHHDVNIFVLQHLGCFLPALIWSDFFQQFFFKSWREIFCLAWDLDCLYQRCDVRGYGWHNILVDIGVKTLNCAKTNEEGIRI